MYRQLIKIKIGFNSIVLFV